MDINQIREILPHRQWRRFQKPVVAVSDNLVMRMRLAIWNCKVEREGICRRRAAGIGNVRFRKPVVASDTLMMRMTLVKLQKHFGIAKLEGEACSCCGFSDFFRFPFIIAYDDLIVMVILLELMRSWQLRIMALATGNPQDTSLVMGGWLSVMVDHAWGSYLQQWFAGGSRGHLWKLVQ
ncbi:3-hydroxyacyl-[acyl-carrier-protein] dehydratase [Sarracenia purpurea var. burkii]